MQIPNKPKTNFVGLKSNLALLYNKGHNFCVFQPDKLLKTEYVPTKRIIFIALLPPFPPYHVGLCSLMTVIDLYKQ